MLANVPSPSGSHESRGEKIAHATPAVTNVWERRLRTVTRIRCR